MIYKRKIFVPRTLCLRHTSSHNPYFLFPQSPVVLFFIFFPPSTLKNIFRHFFKTPSCFLSISRLDTDNTSFLQFCCICQMFYFLPMSRLDTDNTSFLQFCCIGCQMFTLNFQLLCPTFCTDNCAVFRWLHCNVCLLAIIDLLVVSLHLNRSLVLHSSNSLFFLINLHLWVFPHPVLLSIVFETYFTKTPQFGYFYYCYGSLTVTSTSQESVMFTLFAIQPASLLFRVYQLQFHSVCCCE